MTVELTSLRFSRGVWSGVISLPDSAQLFIRGDAEFFADPDNVKKLETLADRLLRLANDALEFAMNSVYASEIEAGCGLILDSIVLENWDDSRVWFQLGSKAGKFLGVRVIQSQPVDVYCES